MSILQNSQDALNAAQQGLAQQIDGERAKALHRERVAQEQARQAEHRVRLLDLEAREPTPEILQEIRLLKGQLNAAQDEIRALDKIIDDRDEKITEQTRILDEWVVSQMAFKSLFKQFGRLPDGTPVADLPKEERQKIVDDALNQARHEVSAKSKPGI